VTEWFLLQNTVEGITNVKRNVKNISRSQLIEFPKATASPNKNGKQKPPKFPIKTSPGTLNAYI